MVCEEKKIRATTGKQQVSILSVVCATAEGFVSRIMPVRRGGSWRGAAEWLGAATTPSDRRHLSERAAYNGNESSLLRHTLNTTQTATGGQMHWEISGSRHCHHSQQVPMVAITSIHLASSQSISLRFYLPITYPSGAKTVRFNTTNTKARQWTQS